MMAEMELQASLDRLEMSIDMRMKKYVSLEKALRKLIKAAKRFQLADEGKDRQGWIWDSLYEAIENAESLILPKRRAKRES